MTELNAMIAHIPIPARMRRLKISEKGFPVPWFVAVIDGKPDFRVVEPEKWSDAIRHKKCWLCGDTLGRYQCFVLSPMCIVNRTTAEPPCHRDCAEYAVKACPFLTSPRARRNEKDLPDHQLPPGEMITRNPGVCAIWSTEGYKVRRDNTIDIGNPRSLTFFAHGRTATRDEIVESIETGLPLLREIAVKQPGGLEMLEIMTRRAMMLVPT